MGAILTASLRLIKAYTLALSLQFSRFIGNYCHQLDSETGLIRKPPNLELAKEKSWSKTVAFHALNAKFSLQYYKDLSFPFSFHCAVLYFIINTSIILFRSFSKKIQLQQISVPSCRYNSTYHISLGARTAFKIVKTIDIPLSRLELNFPV